MQNARRQAALQKASALSKRISKRRKGKSINSAKVLEKIRQERAEEILGL